MQFPIFDSENIILRKVRSSDANDLLKIFSNETVMNFLETKSTIEIENIQGRIETILENYNYLKQIHWVIELKKTKTVIGWISLFNFNYLWNLEYCLHPDFWNKKIMKSSLEKILNYCKENHIKGIIGKVVFDNEYSIRILEYFGFTYKGIEKSRREGFNKVSVVYQIDF